MASLLNSATRVSSPARPASLAWFALPLVAFGYAGTAAVSLNLAIEPGYASAVWPAAGLALAAWLAFGGRIWPAILIGAALANLGVIGTPPWVALAIGAGNAAEAALAGTLARRFVGLRDRFESPAAVWRFAAIAFGAAMVAATNGVATLALAGLVPWAEFGTHWVTWWLGDATGMIIVAPLLLCWRGAAGGTPDGSRRTEYQLFGGLLGLLALCGVLPWAMGFPAEAVQKLAYLMIPLVTWAAARLDQRAVAAASFAVAAVAVLDMLDGAATMFPLVPWNQSLLLLQLFVSAVALSGLTLSALAGNALRMNGELQSLRAALEREAQKAHADLDQARARQAALAKRIVGIREEEQRRLAANLHDGVAQDLTSLTVSLDLIRTGHARRDAGSLARQVEEAMALARRAGAALREAIAGLRPPVLSGLPLASALRQHAAAFEARTGILVNVVAPPARDTLPVPVKDTLIRICLEALANVGKHADATAVRISLRSEAGAVCLIVEDDGRGLDDGAGEPGRLKGAGLAIMRERAAAIGAELKIDSTPGVGLRIEVTCPFSAG